MRAQGGVLRRFVSFDAKPARSGVLSADHPAAVEGHTIFRANVHPVDGSQRFLISGHNNAKIGKAVTKGEWAGFPIFTLTLEERATCPRSCAQWLSCYGNAMHWPKRWDASDPDFVDTLRAEIITTSRTHPGGLVVRLHVLGDFFSTAYVRMWAEMLDRFPQLHVYGYTAHAPESEIGRALAYLAGEAWDQFALRFSSAEAGPQRAIVIDAEIDAPDVLMCPAQGGATETCGTCGLCWAPAARAKTIAFLRHGMVRATGPRPGPKPRATIIAAPRVPTGAAARLAAIPQSERDRIARQYGAAFRVPEAA